LGGTVIAAGSANSPCDRPVSDPANHRSEQTLQVDQDLRFEQRWLVVERTGWALLTAILLAGVLGLFGGAGPLMRSSVGKGSALEVDYHRFARHHTSIDMRVHLRADALPGTAVRMRVNADYLEAVQLEGLNPEPDRVEVHDEGLIYVFEQAHPGAGGTFVFHLRPLRSGAHAIRLAVEGGPERGMTQLVYP